MPLGEPKSKTAQHKAGPFYQNKPGDDRLSHAVPCAVISSTTCVESFFSIGILVFSDATALDHPKLAGDFVGSKSRVQGTHARN